MGLFGKKKNAGSIPVQFYEGDLPGFLCDFPCQIRLEDEYLLITKVNPSVEVKLNRDRILGVEIFIFENQYMTKYKGVNITTTKEKSTPKQYYVFHYVDKNGNKKHLDFWGTSFETGKIQKIQEALLKNNVSSSYKI